MRWPSLSEIGLTVEQRLLRLNALGGSDANTLMSGNEAKILRLWREKRGEVEPEDLSDNLAVQMGAWTEALNCQWFEKQTGRRVMRDGHGSYAGPHPFMRCTVDGIVAEADDLAEALFEAKHCGTRNTDAEIFARYVPQLSHNLICVGLTTAFLSVFKGNGDWMVMEYELDDAYAARLIEAEREFWRCVETGEPPCAVPAEPTPKPVGVVEYDMSASNSWAAFAGEYLETKLAADRHEGAKRELKGLVPDDASKCFGHGIEIKRTKAGALRFASTGDE